MVSDGIAESLLDLLKDAGPNVLLNVAQLEYVSSMGLRVFVRAAKAVKASGGKLKMCCPTPTVMKVLEISALEHVLDVVDDEALAVTRF